MTISTDSSTAPSYSINIGGTTLETTDIDFIHALQNVVVQIKMWL